MVVVPAEGRHCIFRLKHVGDWGIINNYHILHVAAEPGQVFHKRIIVVGAMFAEELIATVVLGVELEH